MCAGEFPSDGESYHAAQMAIEQKRRRLIATAMVEREPRSKVQKQIPRFRSDDKRNLVLQVGKDDASRDAHAVRLHAWANRRAMEAASKLTAEQSSTDGLELGSVRDTLAHV